LEFDRSGRVQVRVQLASWQNLILTFRSFDLIRQLVRRSGSIVRQRRSSVRLVFEDNHEYKSGTRKKLRTLAKVVEVVTS
jgi:hypothetical protein